MKERVEDLLSTVASTEDIFEKARTFYELIHQHDYRMTELANLLDMKPSYISHYLRLNRLPVLIADGYYSKLVSPSHLFIIARLDSEDTMISVYEEVLAKNLSTSQTEELVREQLYNTKSVGNKITEVERNQIIYELRKIVTDADVQIVQTRIKAKVTMEIKGSLKKTSDTLRKAYRKLANTGVS